jgi:membrane-associated protease RseP (regulator of RpoE activity)
VSDESRFRIDAPTPPKRSRFWFVEHPLFHLLLFGATFVTTTIAGGAFSPTLGLFGKNGQWTDGLAFSLPLLTILGVHELGHWAMCRHYGIAATLPYFLPFPLPLLTYTGTLGAVIRIKEPIRRRQQLLDIGASGPIAGFLASIPFLIYGVSRAYPIGEPAQGETTYFDYPLLVRFAQDLTHTARYTSHAVHENATFMAAWFGLLVTAFNLLPIGQLDGGHVLRAAVGKRQPLVSAGVLGLAVLLVFSGIYAWAIWASLASLLVGLPHPPTEDEDVPLGHGRQFVALLCIAIFLLCFTASPIRME